MAADRIAPHGRQTFADPRPSGAARRMALVGIGLLPAAGLGITAPALPAVLNPGGLLLSMIVTALLLHLAVQTFRSGRSGQRLTLLPPQALIALLGISAVLLCLIHRQGGARNLPLLPLLGGWLLGAGALVLLWGLSAAEEDRTAQGPGLFATAGQAGLGFAIITTLLIAAQRGGDLLVGAPAPPSDLSAPCLIGLYASTAALLTSRGIRGWIAAVPPPQAGEGLAMTLAAALGLSIALALPALSWAREGGSAALALLATVATLLLTGRGPAARLLAAMGLIAATPLFTALALDGPPLARGIAALLLAGTLAGIHVRTAAHATAARGGAAPPHILALAQQAGNSWLMRLDPGRRTATFPLGAPALFGAAERIGFAELFAEADLGGLLDLMQALHQPLPRPGGPIILRLPAHGPPPQMPAADTDSATTRRLRPFALHLLDRQGAAIWICATSLDREAEQVERVGRYERLLSEAILREERLLSVASHELRTPVAILSMLAEELNGGLPWAEARDGVGKALDRIVAILDDLRADGAEGGLAIGGSFTQRSLLAQILDLFRPAARANGMEIATNLSQQADLPLCGDHGRVFLALSKLVHNAIIHSGGDRIVIDGFLSHRGAAGVFVTWQISDNGTGIPAAHQSRIFEPFETTRGQDGDRPGLGLYTARKAIRLMGGDLVLGDSATGSRFILTHPARMATLAQPSRSEVEMTETPPAYPDRAALLIEDNRLVGEITSARLRKLFARVRWAETGPDGLTMYRDERPDILIVDQRLPGLNGSDLVQRIRESDPALPIIGITASAMGSECRALEAAGVDMALEKPVSFGQLADIATGFFGAAPASP